MKRIRLPRKTKSVKTDGIIVGSNQISKRGFLPASRRVIRGGIVMCVFGLLGVIGLYYSQAATTPSVRFVVFCASDKCDYGTSIERVQARGKYVRSWFKTELDGKTFRQLNTVRITGPHTAGWYNGRNSGVQYSGSSQPVIGNVIDNITHDLQKTRKLESNVKMIMVLGYDILPSTSSNDHCGVGYTTFPVAVVDAYDNDCAAWQNSAYAHELTHTWGLGHSTDGTLMNQPAACSGKVLSKCDLSSSTKGYLLSTRSNWFSGATATAADYDADVVPASAPEYADPEPVVAAPPPAPTSGPAPVNLYKFYNAGIIDNLYSTNRNDGALTLGYSYQGCVAKIFPSQASNTVPLYRYFNSGNNGAFGGDTFYTTTRNDAGYANTGYGYVGITGYVFSSNAAGTVPFKRYFAGAPKTDHFYTVDAWTSGFLDYNFENYEGYVYPPPADRCGPTDPAPPSPNKVVLHKYYQPNWVDNHYVADGSRDDAGWGAHGYSYQGCAALVWDRPVPGSTPLYQYWNSTGTDHFFTIDRNDAGYAGYGYGFEIVVGHVFRNSGVGGTAAFNRYFAGAPKTDHFYTMDAWTNGFLGYYFENTEAYTYRCN